MKQKNTKSIRIITKLFKFSFLYSDLNKEGKRYVTGLQREEMIFDRCIRGKPQIEIDSKLVLKNLFKKALIFKYNKNWFKAIIETLMMTLSFYFIAFIPVLYPFLYFKQSLSIGEYFISYVLAALSIYLVATVSHSIGAFIDRFISKLNPILIRLCGFTIQVVVCSIPAVFWNMHESVFKAGLLSGSIMYTVVMCANVFWLFVELWIDFIYYSRKIQIADALIIESAFILTMIDWNKSINNNILKNRNMAEIERLAGLFENDLSEQLKPKDVETNKWKKDSFKLISDGLRRLKRKTILADAQTLENLRVKINEVFDCVLKNEYLTLIEILKQEGQDADKAASKFSKIQSLLVAILPIIGIVAVHFISPDLLTGNVYNGALLISIFWLILSLMLWLDPGIAEKLSSLKTMKSIMNKNGGDE